MLLGTILLLLCVPLAGQFIDSLIERKEYIVPAMLVAVVADSWSVFWGPSKALMESGVVHHFTVNYPVAGVEDLPPQPIVGVMDWLFVSFLFFFSQRYALGIRRFLASLVLGFSAGLIILTLLGTAIPLLAALGPAFVLVHYPLIRPGRKEIRTTLLFCLIMIATFWLAGLVRQTSADTTTPTEKGHPIERGALDQ
jgi:hypothetical protein